MTQGPDNKQSFDTRTPADIKQQLEARRDRLRGVQQRDDQSDQATRPSRAIQTEVPKPSATSSQPNQEGHTVHLPTEAQIVKERSQLPIKILCILNIALFTSILFYFSQHPEAVPNFKVFATEGNQIVLVTSTETDEQRIQLIVEQTMAAFDATATTQAEQQSQIEAAVAATAQSAIEATATPVEPSPTTWVITATPTELPTQTATPLPVATDTQAPTIEFVTATPTDVPLFPTNTETSQMIVPERTFQVDTLTLHEPASDAPIQWKWADGVSQQSIQLGGLYNTSNQPMNGRFAPDGSTVSWEENGNTIVTMPAVRQEFMGTLNPDGTFSTMREVFRPDRQPTKYGTWEYAGIPTIFDVNGQKYGLSHMESWSAPDNGTGFTAQIGLVKWDSASSTWKLVDTVIEGMHPLPAGEKVSGAGQPSSFIKDGYLYTLFVEWNTGGADTLHATRVPVNEVENPDAWMTWDGKGFNQPSTHPSQSAPVMFPEAGEGYISLPNVITTETGAQFVVVETATSFKVIPFDITTMKFGQHETLLDFPNPQKKYDPGSIWYSYPGLIDPRAIKPQEIKTGNPLSFVFSKGYRGDAGHTPESLAITITSANAQG